VKVLIFLLQKSAVIGFENVCSISATLGFRCNY